MSAEESFRMNLLEWLRESYMNMHKNAKELPLVTQAQRYQAYDLVCRAQCLNDVSILILEGAFDPITEDETDG